MAGLLHGRLSSLLAGKSRATGHIPPPLRPQVRQRACYVPRAGFCYFRLPKVANSTICKTLASHAFGGERFGENDPTGAAAKAALQRFPDARQFARSYSFAFVRDPVPRVLSAWRDKAPRPKFGAEYGLNTDGVPVSFTRFLEMLQEGLLLKDPHWAPQSVLLPYDPARYAFIGRFERLEPDMETLCRHIFGRFDGLTTRTAGRTGASGADVRIAPENRQMIYRLYERDYDLFYSEILPV